MTNDPTGSELGGDERYADEWGNRREATKMTTHFLVKNALRRLACRLLGCRAAKEGDWNWRALPFEGDPYDMDCGRCGATPCHTLGGWRFNFWRLTHRSRGVPFCALLALLAGCASAQQPAMPEAWFTADDGAVLVQITWGEAASGKLLPLSGSCPPINWPGYRLYAWDPAHPCIGTPAR
jgi:hypothetical protein